MAENADKKEYSPERGYKVEVTIAGQNKSDDVQTVRIISNITNSYQTVIVTMALDPADVIRDRIFGKEPIKMVISYIGRGMAQAALEQVEFELVHLSSASAITQTSEMNTNQTKELKMMTFVTVPKKPFATVSYTSEMNQIFFGKTPKQIIQSLVSKTQAELVYDSDGENSDPIEQVLITPTTLYNSILYLDNTFGLFDGACNLGFCQYDNKLYILNLTKRLTKSQVFTIYQLARDDKKAGETIAKCNDGQNFYSYADVVSTYSANSHFATKATKIKHVFKPSDDLYRVYDLDVLNKIDSLGVISKNSEIDYDSVMQQRESYRTTMLGESDIVANARVARQLISLATLTIRLERNLQVMNLMRVGEPVKFHPKINSYVDLSGKYILKTSDIILNRSTRNFMSDATITLCRTNKTI